MSLFSFGRLAVLAVTCVVAPAALAQGSSPEPDHGSAFQCEDGSKLYLDFAELQARNRKQMFMADWIVKLDQFLAISDRAVLTGAGRISAKVAKAKADKEYDRWHARMIEAPSAVEQHFLEATQAAKRIEATRPKTGRKGEPQ